MKKLIFYILILSLYACAGTTQVAKWKTLPEADIPYDEAWPIVVSTISENFDLETIDGQSGYLKSDWMTTDSCWAGLANGGMTACKQTRVIVRVEKRTPFKFKIKVEQMEMSTWTFDWYRVGNDTIIEAEIMETLSGRLRRF